VERLISIEGQPPSALSRAVGCTFADRCPERFEKCSEEPVEVSISAGHVVSCWRHV
jgi:peptide/nickel transport system ATP-binding protein